MTNYKEKNPKRTVNKIGIIFLWFLFATIGGVIFSGFPGFIFHVLLFTGALYFLYRKQ